MSASLREGLLGAFCGAQGGVLAQWITLPIETVQKVQASTGAGMTIMQIARKIYAEDGLAGFWLNIVLLTFQLALEKSIFFFCFVLLKRATERTTKKPISPGAEVVVGYTADLLRLPVRGGRDELVPAGGTHL